MHEMFVASGVMKVLDGKLKEQGPCKLLAMDVAVGEFSGIEDESLRLALQTMLDERGHSPVEIRFEKTEALFECYACAWKGREEKFTAICPECGAGAVFIVGGQDVTLESIEVE